MDVGPQLPLTLPAAGPIRFQSLFSWMSGLSTPETCEAIREHMFQSLFSWMSGLSSFKRSCPQPPSEVSILVLMDVGPQLESSSLWAATRSVFQSLFSWMSGLSLEPLFADAGVSLFQSLFSWMS